MPEEFTKEELAAIKKYQATVASAQFKKAVAALQAFDKHPTQTNLAAVRKEIVSVMADIKKTKEWTGDEEKGILGWPDRNKAAIQRLDSERRGRIAAKRVQEAEELSSARKESEVRMRRAILEERLK